MRFPLVREHVRVKGRTGTFLVLAVDRERALADVVSITGGGSVEENVPLDSILRLSSPEPDKQGGPDTDLRSAG